MVLWHDSALLEMIQFENACRLLESSEFVRLMLKQWQTRVPFGSNLCRTAKHWIGWCVSIPTVLKHRCIDSVIFFLWNKKEKLGRMRTDVAWTQIFYLNSQWILWKFSYCCFLTVSLCFWIVTWLSSGALLSNQYQDKALDTLKQFWKHDLCDFPGKW